MLRAGERERDTSPIPSREADGVQPTKLFCNSFVFI